MRFLVDAQLPPSLSNWLRARGEAADHLLDLDVLGASDAEIWALALAQGYVLVTKDRDFVDWAVSRRPRPQVLWLRIGNTGNRTLETWLDRAWPEVAAALEQGDPVVSVARR